MQNIENTLVMLLKSGGGGRTERNKWTGKLSWVWEVKGLPRGVKPPAATGEPQGCIAVMTLSRQVTSLTVWHSRACPTVPLLLTQVPQAGKEAPLSLLRPWASMLPSFGSLGHSSEAIAFFCSAGSADILLPPSAWETNLKAMHTCHSQGWPLFWAVYIWTPLLILILHWTTSLWCGSASTAHTEVLDRNSVPAELK